MTTFYDLPIEIQETIYKYKHRLEYQPIVNELNYVFENTNTIVKEFYEIRSILIYSMPPTKIYELYMNKACTNSKAGRCIFDMKIHAKPFPNGYADYVWKKKKNCDKNCFSWVTDLRCIPEETIKQICKENLIQDNEPRHILIKKLMQL